MGPRGRVAFEYKGNSKASVLTESPTEVLCVCCRQSPEFKWTIYAWAALGQVQGALIMQCLFEIFYYHTHLLLKKSKQRKKPALHRFNFWTSYFQNRILGKLYHFFQYVPCDMINNAYLFKEWYYTLLLVLYIIYRKWSTNTVGHVLHAGKWLESESGGGL